MNSKIFKAITYSLLMVCVFLLSSCQQNQQNIKNLTFKNIAMKLTSPSFNNEQYIPADFTCDGKDVNPKLTISEVPANTKSLVLIVDDPDAPAGDWAHWLVWNIKPDTKEIAQAGVPAGAKEGTTDFGKSGWGGPCPPSGTHRYYFKLYALDTELSLPTNTRKKDLEQGMDGHVLDQASLMGKYKRK